MASGAGSQVGNSSGNRMWLSWQTDQSPASVASGTTSVTVRLRIWFESPYAISDSSNSFTVSGDWPTRSGVSVSISHGSAGGTTLIYDQTITVSTVIGSTVARSFSSSISGINAISGTAAVSGSHTVAARPVVAPAAPGTPTAERTSDASHTVSWTLNATGAAPYTSQQVQRSVYSGTWGPWVTLTSTLSGSATSYTDTTTVANRAYQYRVVAVNDAGSAASWQSAQVNTTPAAPSGLAAAKSGGDITVTGTRNSTLGRGDWYEWQDNPGGTGWVDVAGTTTTPDRTFSSVNAAVTHAYRSRAVVDTTYPATSGTLTSAWSEASNTVQLQAAPGAPLLGAAFNPDLPSALRVTGVVDRSLRIRLPFTHQPVDTTAQTAAQVQWRLNGGAWTTVTLTTETYTTVTAPGVQATLEWQARTKGAHADYGPWSAIQSVTVSARSTVTINSPAAGTLAQSRMTVTWAHFNAAGLTQAGWRARLVHAGATIQTLTGTNTASAATFSTALLDGETYTVEMEVRGSNLMWSDTDTVTVTTSFPKPYPGTVEASFDRETGANTITLTVDTSIAGRVAVDEVDVEWWNDDRQQWETITEALDPASSVTHPLPYLGENRYRAITRNTALPSETIGDVSVTVYTHDRCPVYVNAGSGWGTVATAITNNISDTPTREAALYEWAGVNLPSSVYGPHRGRRIGVDGSIRDKDRTSTPAMWREIAYMPGDVWYRDCGERDGHGPRRVHGMLTVTDTQQTGRHVNRIRFTIDQTGED